MAVVSVRSARRAPELDTWVVRKRGFSKLLVTLVVAGGVAYFGINHLRATEGQPLARLSLPSALQWARLGTTQAPVVTAGTPAAAAAGAAPAPAEAQPTAAKAREMRAAAGKAASAEAAPPSPPATTGAPADETSPGPAATPAKTEAATARGASRRPQLSGRTRTW